VGDSLKDVVIYTDGACSGNPGPGGWAAILIYNGVERIVSCGEPATTNNRMELTAAIRGLQMLNRRCAVRLYSDSAYLIDALAKGWLERWRLNMWKTAGKKDVKNRDLWEIIASLCLQHEIAMVKVKGHSDNEYNNRCDALARMEIKKILADNSSGAAHCATIHPD
jgi:ribonuclease HI